MSSEILKVLLVDDHAVVRRGMRAILEAKGNIACVEAGCAEDALQLLDSGVPLDVVLLDISLPGMSGLDALAEIRQRRPQLAVLLISMFPEEQYATRALRLGAAGYLCKSSSPSEIERAVLSVSHGNIHLSRAALQVAQEDGANQNRPLHESLSSREFTVLRMIGAGKPVSEIAGTLGLSVKTVSTYRERILEKMKLSNNYGIIRYVLQEGLLE
jgi:DNA-binding NarL/FixJ family response regulator